MTDQPALDPTPPSDLTTGPGEQHFWLPSGAGLTVRRPVPGGPAYTVLDASDGTFHVLENDRNGGWTLYACCGSERLAALLNRLAPPF